MSLKEMIETGLPLNRKERYFTGTVIPMIICKDNFRHFGTFLDLIGVTEYSEIKAKPEESNIEFFTEYSLKESIYSCEDKKRFTHIPETKDTPDLMILMKRSDQKRLLIIIEAKMYGFYKEQSLHDQIKQQAVTKEFLKTHLNLDEIDIHHIILIPDQLLNLA